MKKTLSIAAAAFVVIAASPYSFGQATPGTTDTKPSTTQSSNVPVNTGLVSIDAKGTDVRDVLHQLFNQAGKNFVIEPGVRFVLYLTLDKVPYDQALSIVCDQAKLKSDVRDGIVYISAAPIGTKKELLAAKSEPKSAPIELNPSVLTTKRVTTRLAKADIHTVFTAIAKETGVTIVLTDDVPAYKLDAFLIHTSLKYALDQITTATSLTYKIVGDHIEIAPLNHVAVIKP